uniref:Uncharacterized protein n=1 Tax=Oryza punctata TaxID=4537 RepID=A0A0E0JY73_ORYPU
METVPYCNKSFRFRHEKKHPVQSTTHGKTKQNISSSEKRLYRRAVDPNLRIASKHPHPRRLHRLLLLLPRAPPPQRESKSSRNPPWPEEAARRHPSTAGENPPSHLDGQALPATTSSPKSPQIGADSGRASAESGLRSGQGGRFARDLGGSAALGRGGGGGAGRGGGRRGGGGGHLGLGSGGEGGGWVWGRKGKGGGEGAGSSGGIDTVLEVEGWIGISSVMVPIINHNEEDKLCWKHISNGVCNTKSAYKEMRKMEAQTTVISNTTGCPRREFSKQNENWGRKDAGHCEINQVQFPGNQLVDPLSQRHNFRNRSAVAAAATATAGSFFPIPS